MQNEQKPSSHGVRNALIIFLVIVPALMLGIGFWGRNFLSPEFDPGGTITMTEVQAAQTRIAAQTEATQTALVPTATQQSKVATLGEPSTPPATTIVLIVPESPALATGAAQAPEAIAIVQTLQAKNATLAARMATLENQLIVTLQPTATGTPTALPTSTLAPTWTPTSTPTLTAAPPTATPTAVPPTATQLPSPTPSARSFTLLEPNDLDQPSYGLTTFEWEWHDAVAAGYGFEVRVWREGEPQAGVHDATLDNQNGVVKSVGPGHYKVEANIKTTPGVNSRSGQYHWTVCLVQTSPEYKDLGICADPALLRFEAGGGGSSNGPDADPTVAPP